MKSLRELIDKIKPNFEKGGKFEKHSKHFCSYRIV